MFQLTYFLILKHWISYEYDVTTPDFGGSAEDHIIQGIFAPRDAHN
jgi:hypothetical protein